MAGPMAVSVREVLGSLMSPSLCDQVLEVALDRASLSAVPEEAGETKRFVKGALRDVVEKLLSLEAADAMIAGLQPMLNMAESNVWVERPSERPTRLPPAAGGRADEAVGLLQADPGHSIAPEPVVLMATLDKAGVERVARTMGTAAAVHQAKDAFDLVQAMETHQGHATLIVIDCCVPAVDPTTVGHMFPILPEGAQVVLWGANDGQRERIEQATPTASEWVACSDSATHEELALILRSLL